MNRQLGKLKKINTIVSDWFYITKRTARRTKQAENKTTLNTKKTEPHSIDTTSQRPDVLFFVLHPTLNHHTRIQHQSP